jgi:hypothetical protein
MMKTIMSFMIILVSGMIFLPGCAKETQNYVPISFTDKDGTIFIKIDTLSNSFVAYSKTKISNGLLKGIFNDSIRPAFDLAIITEPFQDTIYHERDTVVFPTHYPGHLLFIKTVIDLSKYTSPYHFLLLGIPKGELKRGLHGNPSIMLTIDTRDE